MRNQKTNVRRIVALLFVLTLCFSVTNINANAATRAKINKKQATIYVGKSITLKVINNKKKVKWRTLNKTVATVTNTGVVKGKSVGNTTIVAKAGKKHYKCKIKVNKIKSSNRRTNSTSKTRSKYNSKTSSKSTSEYTVYITDTGSKYHTAGCRYLWNSSHSISVSNAKAEGYSPCSICNP